MLLPSVVQTLVQFKRPTLMERIESTMRSLSRSSNTFNEKYRGVIEFVNDSSLRLVSTSRKP